MNRRERRGRRRDDSHPFLSLRALRPLRSIFLFCLCGLSAQEAWTPFNDPANTQHPERVRKIDVEHYDIAVKFDDKKNGEIEGYTTIALAPLADAEMVELDATDMTFSSVTLGGGSALRFRAEADKVVVELGRTAKKGEKLSLTLAYTGKPKHGLIWVTPDEGYPDKQWMVWSQGETDYNHHWFPCYDFPNDRATWEIRVTYPARYLSVSNGDLVESETIGEWKTDHWKQDVPAVSYLVSLIVGDFQRYDDSVELHGRKIALQYYVPRGMYVEGDVRASFGRTGDMIRFFSEKTGVDYPYSKYAQTVVRDFIWGGMENLSATTLVDNTVVPARARMDRDSDGLIAHELAHQWFGDLVTCRDWSEVWLNEGFATYFGALWFESVEGPDHLAEEVQGMGEGYVGASRSHQRPIVCDVYTDADDMFDAWSYPKGGYVLHMLRSTIGDAAWWKGINLYLTRHRAQVVSTKDFQAAMEDAAGQKLDWFFNQWLYRMGHPEFEVRTKWDGARSKLTMTVEQKQNVSDVRFGTLVTGGTLFRVAADVELVTGAGRKIVPVLIDKASQVFEIDLDAEP